MSTESTKIMPKLCFFKLYCEKCDYGTNKKSCMDTHKLSAKHQKSTESTKIMPKLCSNHICTKCNKKFKDRSGLWRHNKKCDNLCENKSSENIKLNEITNNEIKQSDHNFVCDKELVMKLINQNNELQSQVLELLKSGTHNTHTNSHNKTFNLNFFLNETCKNAMNIMDFVNNLQLQLNDLEKMGEIGYVNGMSEIIIKNLKGMDVTERPIHCTDKKRETLYVKDEDKWDKEPNDHPKVRHAIKHIAHKNSKLLNEFKEKYPDYNNSSSTTSDTYNKILIETMGGKGDNDLEKDSKIIRNVTKEIVVDK